MRFRNRLRRLEERRAVAGDTRKAERFRISFNAANRDPAANRAFEEIADAQFDYGHNDPRTLAIIERLGPVIAAAIERYAGDLMQ